MVGKLLSAVTVSLAMFAPMQSANGQSTAVDDSPFATAAVFSQDSNWQKAIVNPGTTYFYLTGSDAEVAELDLFIYNQDGKLLMSHTGPGDEATLRLASKQTAVVLIEVRNVGKLDSKYELDVQTPAIRKR
jgi:hypothetical protein